MRSYLGMQRRGRLPGTIAYSGDEFSHHARGPQRHRPTVAGERKTIRWQAREAHLQALDRGIDVAHGAAGRGLLAHDMPRLERLAQLQGDSHHRDVATFGKAKFKVWCKPCGVERITSRPLLAEHVAEILLDEIRQHEPVMQLSTPARQARRPVRRLPEARD